MASLENTSTVTAHSRLHLGLIDCGYATDRLFGGAGVFIEGFPTIAESGLADEAAIYFAPGLEPSERAVRDAGGLMERIAGTVGPVSVKVTSMAPEHKGFGSKTSLLMAIAQSAFMAYGKHPGEQVAEVVALSGRGGTSGIGVNGFWCGGLIVDGGHNVSDGPRRFAPSSGRTPERIPPLVARAAMPENWKVHLFYDPNAPMIEGEKEKSLFTAWMPIPDSEIYTTMAATYHGLVPAALEEDIERFGSALRTISTHGMKKREISQQTARTQDFLDEAWESGIAAGLTSFGPTVFCVTDASDTSTGTPSLIAETHGLINLGVHKFKNTGADYAHD